MINIEDLLKDYKNIKNPLIEKKEVSVAIKEKFGLDIDPSLVFFRKNILILKISPVQKSFLYIRKNEVLEIIKTIVPNRFITSIQF